MRCPQSIEEEPNENPMFIALLVERDSAMVARSGRHAAFIPNVSFELFAAAFAFSVQKELSAGGHERAYGHASSFEIAHDKLCRSLSLGKGILERTLGQRRAS